MKRARRILSLLLAIALCLSATALAAGGNELPVAANDAAAYILKTVPSAQVGTLGGEWAVIGLARSGGNVPDDYFERYYAAVEGEVTACKGVLSERKYTEYSRVVLALTAIGKNPASVAGYDLLAPLGDFDGVLRQGLTGPVWALIALDAGNYAVPQNAEAKTQATRQMYVDEILSRRLSDGGWSQSGKTPADPDATAMALQALAKYKEQAAVKSAIDGALDCLAELQEPDGGYSSGGVSCCESVAQVVIVLCGLGLSPEDARFAKGGVTLLDRLVSFQLEGGGFSHTKGGEISQMASEQALCALAAALRRTKGESTLYSMMEPAAVPPVSVPDVDFDDIGESASRDAIKALAERGIINGKSGSSFEPDAKMTRAEFAAIVTRALGLEPKDTGAFADVSADRWYAGYIGAANRRGIIYGTGGGLFVPEGTLTRQEATLMTARAARLCGMDTSVGSDEAEKALARFGDGIEISNWARKAAAFCAREGIIDENAEKFEPSRPIIRGEMAQMLFNMLTAAGLI